MQYIYNVHTKLRGVLFCAIFWGTYVQKQYLVLFYRVLLIVYDTVDTLPCVRERAVFKPNTRRMGAGKAAAATQQPNLQSAAEELVYSSEQC